MRGTNELTQHMLDGERPKRQQLKRQQFSTNARELPLLR